MHRFYFPHYPLLLFVLLLTGCGTTKTQFSPMAEPMAGDRARLRVITNWAVRGFPGLPCVDFHSPGAGTAIGGLLGTDGFKNRSLGMPAGMASPDMKSGEMYIEAGKPITLFLASDQPLYCQVGMTFVPQKDQDYEAQLVLDRPSASCSANVISLSEPATKIEVRSVGFCKPSLIPWW